MYKMHPSHVPHYFTCSQSLYRILASGTLQEVTFVEAGRLLVVVDGERMTGSHIAWCLHYGNWPKFQLIQIDGNPHNCAIDNILPARLKRLRNREKLVNGKYQHPLSKHGFDTPEQCHRNWVAHAKDYYLKDLEYVLQLEAQERELRKDLPVPDLPGKRVARERLADRKQRVKRGDTWEAQGRPAKPGVVEGRVWHFYKGAWVSIPEPCHVSDDNLERLRKCEAGAVRFEFQPVYEEVWGFDAAGQVVR